MNKFKELWQRIKENFKKNKVVFFVLAILWIVMVVFVISSNMATLSKSSYGNEYSQNIIEINKNTKIEEVVPILQGSKDIAIKFATYARKNKGNVCINVIGADSKKVYANEVINIRKMEDNAYYTFSLDKPLNQKEDEKIVITLTSNSEEGKGIGVYCSENKYFEDSSLLMNKKTQDGDLTVRFLIYDKEFELFSKTILTFSITIISLLILIIVLINPKYEVLFALIALTIGFVFMIIITPLSVPDEQVHYESSLQLTNYILSDSYHTFIDKAYVNYSHYYGHYNVSLGYTRLIEQINDPLNAKGKIVEIARDIKDVYKVYFVPQSVGVLIGRLLKLNFLKTFYLGRLTNLVFYCLCVYVAIKKIPINKLLIGIVSILPIFIQTAASYSYDCFINGLCLINIGILFKWIYEDNRIIITDYILAFLICLGLAPAKYVYACLATLFMLVPWTRYGSKLKKAIFTFILCAPMLYQLVPILLPRFEMLFETLIYTYNNNVVFANDISKPFLLDYNEYTVGGQMYSLEYVLDHLPETIIFVLFTIRYNIRFWFYGAIGSYLSGSTLVLPHILTYIIIGLLVVCAFKKEKYTPNNKIRISMLLICVIMGLFIVGGMLLYWTNIGDYYIQGIQGRYFCPIIIYFFTVFNNKKIHISKNIDKYVIYVYLLLIFEVIVYVLSYTFVN